MERLSRNERAYREACMIEAIGHKEPPHTASPRPSVRYVCPKEFAELRGVSLSTVRNWIRIRCIPFEQPAGRGGAVLIRVEE